MRPSDPSLDVLVTGASGFFGSALLPRLIDARYHVTAVSRTRRHPAGTGVLSLDLRDLDATLRALFPWRWGAVVHLAGPVPRGHQSWDEAADTIAAHVSLLMHVVAAIPPGWPGRFIHASSSTVYGTPTRSLVAECHPRHPLHPYALAKCLTEDLLGCSRLTDRWLLRMGGLFSERRSSGALFNFMRAALSGEAIHVTTSSPPVPWDILDADDAVEAVLRSLDASARDPGPVNVGYGEPIQLVEIAERMGLRRGSTVIHDGPSPPTFHADISKARRLIDWPPATLDERLDRLWTSIDEGLRIERANA